MQGYLILFKTIKTSLYLTPESPGKMVLKTHWQLTSVLRVNFPQKSFIAYAQISQSGPFFPKTKVSDAKCFDSALQADFDDEPVVLYSVQDA